MISKQTLDRVNMVGEIAKYEAGKMKYEELVPFFQRFIDCGLAYSLGGSYADQANELIKSKACHRRQING